MLMLKCCERKTLFHSWEIILNKLKRTFNMLRKVSVYWHRHLDKETWKETEIAHPIWSDLGDPENCVGAQLHRAKRREPGIGMRKRFLWMHIWVEVGQRSTLLQLTLLHFVLRLLHLRTCLHHLLPSIFFLIDIWPVELFNLLLMCSNSSGHQWSMMLWCCV